MNLDLPLSHQEDTEQGSISLLIVGLVVILLLIASTIIGITSVYIDYKKLQDVADQTALAVAQEIRGLDYMNQPSAQLKEVTVQELAQEFIRSTGAERSVNQTVLSSPTGVIDTDTAQVTLTARAEIPFISQVVPASVEITATGVAQTQLNR